MKRINEQRSLKPDATVEEAISTALDLIKGCSSGPSERIKKTQVDNYVISTINSSDMGLETAIITANKTYVVERYKNIDEALDGHKKWIEFIEDGNREITELGYGIIQSRKVTI